MEGKETVCRKQKKTIWGRNNSSIPGKKQERYYTHKIRKGCYENNIFLLLAYFQFIRASSHSLTNIQWEDAPSHEKTLLKTENRPKKIYIIKSMENLKQKLRKSSRKNKTIWKYKRKDIYYTINRSSKKSEQE